MIIIARKRVPDAGFRDRTLFEAEISPCRAVTAVGEVLNYVAVLGAAKCSSAWCGKTSHHFLREEDVPTQRQVCINPHSWRLPRSWLWWTSWWTMKVRTTLTNVLPANHRFLKWRGPDSNRGLHDLSGPSWVVTPTAVRRRRPYLSHFADLEALRGPPAIGAGRRGVTVGSAST